MRKLLLFVPLTLLCMVIHAQEITFTKEEQALLDSMFQQDDFFRLIDEANSSYVDISLGAGNGVFSTKNNAFNAVQSSTQKLYFTAAVGYFHRSGLSVEWSSFFAKDNPRFTIYQHAINPSYQYSNKKVVAGISYTRFLKGAESSFQVNPYQDDFYASFQYKRSWWQPLLSVGYAAGRYNEYFDTSFIIAPFPNSTPRLIEISDTISTKLTNFSASLSVSHTWDFENVFSTSDMIDLQPSLMLNFGNQRFVTTQTNSVFNRRPRVQELFKRAYGVGTETSAFQLQSAAMMLQAVYYIGNISISPQLYLDYYFPDTDQDRFSALYSISVHYSF